MNIIHQYIVHDTIEFDFIFKFRKFLKIFLFDIEIRHTYYISYIIKIFVLYIGTLYICDKLMITSSHHYDDGIIESYIF